MGWSSLSCVVYSIGIVAIYRQSRDSLLTELKRSSGLSATDKWLGAGVHHLQYPHHRVSHPHRCDSVHHSCADLLPAGCGRPQMVVAVFPEWRQHGYVLRPAPCFSFVRGRTKMSVAAVISLRSGFGVLTASKDSWPRIVWY